MSGALKGVCEGFNLEGGACLVHLKSIMNAESTGKL